MRGLPGLVIAAALGTVGAICNWAYLARQASRMEKEAFVALKGTAQLNLGDRFQEEHLTKVEIPRDNLGNLNEIGIYWKDKASVVGLAATKAYRGNELLLWQDLQTPSTRDFSHLLAKNEIAFWVPADSRSFVPERFSPGNLILFSFPKLAGTPPQGNSREPVVSSSSSTLVGPFRILSMGSRTGDRDPRQAYGRSSGQENLIGISVKVEDGQMESEADRLFSILSTNPAPPKIILMSSALEDEPIR